MKLFLLRHGMTARAESDADRRLTPDGIRNLQEVVGRRKNELRNVAAILSSPLERVRETGRIAGAVFGYSGEVADNPGLRKLAYGETVVSALRELENSGGDLLLVSHESTLCNLIMWLTNEDLLLANSSLVAIETAEAYEKGQGKVLWQESPGGSEIKRTLHWVDQF